VVLAWDGQAGCLAAQRGGLWHQGCYLGSACSSMHSFRSQMIFFIDIGIRRKISLVPSSVFLSGVDFTSPVFPFFLSFSSLCILQSHLPRCFFWGISFSLSPKRNAAGAHPASLLLPPNVLLRSSDAFAWLCPSPEGFRQDRPLGWGCWPGLLQG